VSNTRVRGPAPAPSQGRLCGLAWLGLLAGVLLAACGGSDDDTQPSPSAQAATRTVALIETPASTPEATPTPAPPEASATPAPAPTLTPTATPVQPALQPSLAPLSPSPTASPATSLEPITLTVTARNIEFLPGSLTIPAHVAVTLVMDNQDTGVLHDLGVNVVGGGRTETCKGPCESSFVFAAHVPGLYHFFCSLHPEMVGELRVTE